MKLPTKSEIIEAKDDILDFQEDTDEFMQELFTLYDQSAYRIENEISAYYQKYCDEHGLNHAEAKKMLNKKEFSVWKKSIEEYMKELSADADNTKLKFELDTLSARSRINRQEQLLSNIYKEMGEIATRANIKITHHLQETLIENYNRGLYKIQKSAGIGFDVTKINTKLVKEILAYPWSTKTFSADIWGKVDLLAETVRRELISGLQSGAGIQKITRMVDACMGRGKKNAERVVRTESKYFANQGQMLTYRKYRIDKYRFMGGGCEKCRELNNQVFDIEDAVVGINYPPIHPNCKCTTCAYFELSIFDEQRNVTPLNENIKYQEWKKKYLK